MYCVAFRFRLLLLCLSSLLLGNTHACSTLQFTLAGKPAMARNYDWMIGNGLVMVNKRGIAKRALSFDNPAEWTSKYGSVTINQYGRELPCDGINERGLAVTCLWLNDAEYPAKDNRPSVNTAQWIQYQLDTATTVTEVIENNKRIRLTPFGGAKLHYFVSDATGDCAVIEYLEGEQVIHRGDSLPHRLITNSPCRLSANFLKLTEGLGGEHAIPTGTHSLSRYARLAAAARRIDESSDLADAGFATIDQVRQHSTQWQVVYDLQSPRIYFRTKNHQAVRSIDLAECDFEPATAVRVLDLRAPLAGNVIHELKTYTREANRQLVEASMAGTPLTKDLPAALVRLAIDYPERHCKPVLSTVRENE